MKLSTTRLIWIIAVVPISAATIALASGNLLALGTLEALEATSTLRIRVALSPTCFQVFGFAVVAATQRYISGVVRSAVVRPLGIVAVVPIFAAPLALASGNLLAVRTLEALEALSTLRIRVALSPTCFQVFGIAAVAATQRYISGVVRSAVVRPLGFVAVIPVLATAWAGATRNLLAIRALEALEALSTLRIRVALSPTCFQVFGFAVVRAAQHVVAPDNLIPIGVVAVIPILATTCAFATGNRLAIGTLEALESVGAMLIIITLSVTSSQIFGVGVVRTGQHFDTTRCRVVAVVPVFAPACTVTTRDLLAFGALETLEPRGALRMRVAFAETCFQVFGTAVVATTKLFGAEWLFRGYKLFPIGVVAVIPILATTFAFATGNRLAIGTLEALESVPTMRIIIAFSETSFQ